MTERITPFPDGSALRQLVYRALDGARFEYVFRRRHEYDEWELLGSYYEPAAEQ
jgi:hypothetical protein